MAPRLKLKDVNAKIEVLEERVDGLREDVQELKNATKENAKQIDKVHDRINNLLANEFKHISVFGGTKKEIVKGAGFVTVIYLLIEFIKWILTTLV